MTEKEETVFERILKKMQENILDRRYMMTLHADEERDDDDLSVFDIENGILTGEITERQKDIITGEWKYLVRDRTLEGDTVIIVGKLSLTGKLIIITVFRE